MNSRSAAKIRASRRAASKTRLEFRPRPDKKWLLRGTALAGGVLAIAALAPQAWPAALADEGLRIWHEAQERLDQAGVSPATPAICALSRQAARPIESVELPGRRARLGARGRPIERRKDCLARTCTSRHRHVLGRSLA